MAEPAFTRRAFIGGATVLGLGAAGVVATTGPPFGGGDRTISFWHLFSGGDDERVAQIIWPFVVTTARSLQTIPVGLSTVNSFYGAQYAQVMALAILGALPLLIAFLFFQRQIVQGISNTALKG